MRTSAFSTLKPPVLQRLEKEGFLEASTIQELAIPAILSGENVLLIAPTGTGKTLAAILPVLDRLIEARARKITGNLRPLRDTTPSSQQRPSPQTRGDGKGSRHQDP